MTLASSAENRLSPKRLGAYSLHMSSTSPAPGKSRPADVVNEEIRALWMRAEGQLTVEQRQQYQELVTEWAEAVREEIVKAA